MLDMKTCPDCHGARLKKECLNVFLTVHTGKNHLSSKAAKSVKSKKTDLMDIELDTSSTKFNIADLQQMALHKLIEFVDLYKEDTLKDKTLVDRILNPLLDRAKTIQEL
jgi:excinuclease UvrABC ATPase subunit